MQFSERLASQLWKYAIFTLLGGSLIKAVTDDPRNCKDLYAQGYRSSGVHTICVRRGACSQTPVYCDMATDGGGWTVFQRREDGSEEFYRGMRMYTTGFGSVAGEHWLGLDVIHMLTAYSPHELRVDMSDFDGEERYAKYSKFYVANNLTGYKLTVSGYSGDAGDSLNIHNGMRFTTWDNEQDTWHDNCAVRYHGAWWYKTCYHANPNGNYYGANVTNNGTGITWHHFRTYPYSLKFIEFKMRPL